PVSAKNVVCYFHNWAQYRPDLGKQMAQNVDPKLCTHLVFAFAQLNGTKIMPYEVNDDTTNGQWRQFNDLKILNPKLKTLLAIGGYTHGALRFHQMASTQANRADFISRAINLLRYWEFDGLDIDWEYPSDASVDDFKFFADLLRETREAFDREATIVNKSRLLLSVAVAAGLVTANKSYNVTALDQYVDIVNVMTYDYHGVWENYVGLNAPLISLDGLDVNTTINWYLTNGLRPTKIHMGLAFFGRTWTLTNSAVTLPGSSAIGGGTAGSYTRTVGILSYYEICDLLRNKGYTSKLDYFGLQKYAFSGNQWVSYDDKETLSVKLDYLLQNNLGGAMIWALPEDDFTAQFCGEGSYPLTTLVSSRLVNVPDQTTTASVSTTTASSTPTTTARSTTTTASTTTTTVTTTPTKTTTSSPVSTTTTLSPVSTTTTLSPVSTTTTTTLSPVPKTFTCPSPYGFFPDPGSCSSYYACSFNVPIPIKCPTSTIYNPITKKCENQQTTTFVCTL
ncbi:hypothetical protein Btru_067561, partial [Bulinus truncatus]